MRRLFTIHNLSVRAALGDDEDGDLLMDYFRGGLVFHGYADADATHHGFIPTTAFAGSVLVRIPELMDKWVKLEPGGHLEMRLGEDPDASPAKVFMRPLDDAGAGRAFFSHYDPLNSELRGGL